MNWYYAVCIYSNEELAFIGGATAVTDVTDPLVALTSDVPRFHGIVAPDHDVISIRVDRFHPDVARQRQSRTTND